MPPIKKATTYLSSELRKAIFQKLANFNEALSLLEEKALLSFLEYLESQVRKIKTFPANRY